jgi:hypothetical protein
MSSELPSRIDSKGGSKGAVAKLTVRKTGLQGSFREIQRLRDSCWPGMAVRLISKAPKDNIPFFLPDTVRYMYFARKLSRGLSVC